MESSTIKEKLKWLDPKVVATVLIAKFAILIFGAQSYLTVNNLPFTGANTFLGIWSRWDALHYLKIAQDGYTAIGEDRFLIVFFPFYPALVALVSYVFRDHLLSAFVVSGHGHNCSRLGLPGFGKDSTHSEKIAQWAVLFLFIFPTSYFLHIPYTESTFLALTIGCFLAARKKRWLIAGVLGAVACMTRVNGLILIPALAFELFAEYRETRKIDKKWLFLLHHPGWFCQLPDAELCCGRRPDDVHGPPARTLVPVFQISVDRHNGLLRPDVRRKTHRRSDDRLSGILVRGDRFCRDGGRLEVVARFLLHLDGGELALIRQHVVCTQRAAIHPDAFPAIHTHGDRLLAGIGG